MTAATRVLRAPSRTGECGLCEQIRPLFPHVYKISEYFDHDECSDCNGHEEDTVTKRDLCARCWSNETERQERVQADIDADLGWPDGLSA